ncbi:MAG: rod shape-determining protein MreD [Planctomycetota bacterium]|jgi:rod shape-determining protein MreD
MIHLALLLSVLADSALRLLLPGDSVEAAWLPSIPLVTALYIGLHARRSSQLGYAILLGLLLDCFSARPLGHFGFLLGAAAYVAWKVRRYVPPEAVVPRMVACFIVGCAVAFLGLVLAAASGGGVGNGPGLSRALLVAATSAASAPFVFGIWNQSRLFRRAFRGRRHYELAA